MTSRIPGVCVPRSVNWAEAHRRAGSDQRRRVRVEIPQRRIRVPEQVPPSRRRRRVRRRVGPGDGYGAGRHRRTWRRPPRQVQPRIEPGEIGEPRREPAEVAAVHRPRVEGDHVLDGQPCSSGNVSEIFAVVDHIENNLTIQPVNRAGPNNLAFKASNRVGDAGRARRRSRRRPARSRQPEQPRQRHGA